MESKIVNQAGNWDNWSEFFKEQLQINATSTTIGQKIVFENNDFRIWSIELQANQSLPFHKHQFPYVWTAASNGKALSYYNDGTIKEMEYTKGDTVYFEELNAENYFIHNLINIGETTLLFTTIEFKK